MADETEAQGEPGPTLADLDPTLADLPATPAEATAPTPGPEAAPSGRWERPVDPYAGTSQPEG